VARPSGSESRHLAKLPPRCRQAASDSASGQRLKKLKVSLKN